MNEPQTFRSAFNGFHREDVVNHIAYMTTRHETQTAQLRADNEALRTELEELRQKLSCDTAEQDRIPGLEQTIAEQAADLAALREELETANQLLNEQAEQMAVLREQLEEAKEAAAKTPTLEKSANHWDELRSRLDEDSAAQDRAADLQKELQEQEAQLAAVREELELANQLMNEQAEQMAALREELEEAREAAAKTPIEKSANHWDELRAYRRAETAERQAKERVNDLYDCANTALRGAGSTLADTNAAFEALAEKFRADLVELMNAIETGKNALGAAADTLDTLRPEETE